MPSFRNGLLLCTAPMLLAHGALAQSNSCELLKQTLAARIPPEIKGYALDDVPSKTPVPPGGKVIGTCESGARKVIYRRFGGAPIATDGAAGSAPATAAPATAAPATPTQAAAPAPAPRPASAPAPVVVAKEVPKPKPEPVVTPKPVAPPVAPAPVAAAPKPAPAPPSPPPPPPAPVPPRAPVVRPAPAVAPVASAPAPVVATTKPSVFEKPSTPPAVAASSALAADNDEPGFFSTYGHWLWLILALPFAAWLWSWVAHRMAYDAAGLPRGPRL